MALLRAPKNAIVEPRTGIVSPEWLYFLQDLADRVSRLTTTVVQAAGASTSTTGEGATIINQYGSGTTGTITKWLAAQTLGDSVITEVGGSVLVSGDLTARSFTGGLPAHHTAHEAGGADAIKLDALATPDDVTTLNASVARHGLLPKLSGVNTEVLTGVGIFAPIPGAGGGGAPPAHAVTHEAGGADPIALDTLAPPTDVTTLNASTTAHGLLRKLSGVSTEFLSGAGVFTTPAAAAPAAHHGTHGLGGSDPVALDGTQIASGTIADARLSANVQFKPIAATDLPAHATRHQAGGADAIALDALAAPSDITTLNASTTAHGLLRKLSGVSTEFLTGLGTFATPLPAAPAAHAVTHKAGGTDPIALDTLAAPTNVTTLNATTAAHGLLPKLSGTATDVLTGTGAFAPATVAPGNITPMTANRVIGRNASSGGAAEELTIGAGLLLTGGTTLTATARASSVFPYGFSIATTEPPSAQQVRFDAPYPYTAVTKVWARFEDADSEDLYWGWMRIPIGTTLLVQDKDTHTQYAEVRTTGAPIDKTTYVEVPVVWQGNGTALATQAILVRLTTPPSGAPPAGTWTNVPFSAANFSAIGSMTWTVASGQVVTNRYTLIGKLLIWALVITGSTLGGSVAAELVLQPPVALPSTGPSVWNLVTHLANGGTVVVGCEARTVGTVIQVTQPTLANFATGSLDLAVTFILEIN